MADIFDYIKWRGDLNFNQDPFNEVDSAILSQLVYCDFGSIVYDVSSNQRILLSDVYDLFTQKFSAEEIKNEAYVVKQANEVFKEIVKYPRFKSLYVSKYINDISTSKESQFSAIKVDCDYFTYISFSGTDTSLVGWKENFNMIFLDETPAQNKACHYLNTVINECHENLYVGGHSKGGNLAIYSILKNSKLIRDKVKMIYNHDGAGVHDYLVESQEYVELLPKIHTIVPEFSWVGVLFEHREKLNIVLSNKQGILQHDLTTWKVIQNQFVRGNELNNKSIAIKEASEFIRQLPKNESEILINRIFDIISNHTTDENGKFKKFGFTDFIKILSEFDKLSNKNKRVIYKMIKILMR